MDGSDGKDLKEGVGGTDIPFLLSSVGATKGVGTKEDTNRKSPLKTSSHDVNTSQELHGVTKTCTGNGRSISRKLDTSRLSEDPSPVRSKTGRSSVKVSSPRLDTNVVGLEKYRRLRKEECRNRHSNPGGKETQK